MQDSAATLEADSHVLKQPAVPTPRPGNGAMKFVYATGSRPLDGYTIKRGVGIGGFGEVYFATSDAGKELALKRVQRNLDVEVRGVTQCLNLKHANLIALHDIKYDDKGEGWIVMEYVAGESLKDVIDRNPNGLPHDQVNAWFNSIASGVTYLHDHGIVHRDLKPGNIFNDEGVVKIGDYGLSKFMSCSRRSGQTESVGTFHYMAPEIGKGVYGKEIDVYALGILLFEMLTGCVPFEGESSQEIIMKHLTAEPDLGAIPKPYAEVIRRSLLKDPEKRFSSVKEMIAKLRLGEETDDSPLQRDAFVNASVIGPADVDKPPVQPSAPGKSDSGLLYITEENADAIVFGPVREARDPEISFSNVSSANGNSAALSVPTKEPIAAAIGTGVGSAARWWSNAQIAAPVKVLIVIGAIFFAIVFSEVLIPLGIVGGAAYLVYLGIRSIILAMNGGSATRATNNSVAGSRSGTTTINRDQWRLWAREELTRRTISDRLGELSSSLFGSGIVATAVVAAIMLFTGSFGGIDELATFTWAAVTATAATWMVLVVSKFWEQSEGEQLIRRSAMLVGGIAVGLIAFGTSQFLHVGLNQGPLTTQPVLYELYPSGMFQSPEVPAFPAYICYFAGLFVILRWWRQADPIRPTRFSLWATLVAVLWSFALPLPQPWGLMIAASTSVAIQLAAPWMKPKERGEIRNKLEQQIA